MDNAGPDLWKKKDDLFHIEDTLLPKQQDFESALTAINRARSGTTHHGQAYPKSIAIGIGPTVPFDAFRDVDLDSTIPTRIPPLVWFERLVNLAVNNFIKTSMKVDPEKTKVGYNG